MDFNQIQRIDNFGVIENAYFNSNSDGQQVSSSAALDSIDAVASPDKYQRIRESSHTESYSYINTSDCRIDAENRHVENDVPSLKSSTLTSKSAKSNTMEKAAIKRSTVSCDQVENSYLENLIPLSQLSAEDTKSSAAFRDRETSKHMQMKFWELRPASLTLNPHYENDCTPK